MKIITVHLKVDDDLIGKGDSYQVMDPVSWSVSIDNGVQRYNDDLKSFSQGQRYLFAVMWYLAEVNNGGHHQFYFNSTGIVWKDALAGFKALGLQAAADIIQESAARLGGDPSLDRNERQMQLAACASNIDEIEDIEDLDDIHVFDDLDDRFYELQNNIDIDELMQQYIRANPSAFYFDGEVRRPDYTSAGG